MSNLEETLAFHMRINNIPEPLRQHKFHPKRKWLADFAWEDEGLIVEVEGGIWMQTGTGRGKGHAHPKRFTDDCEKYNEATLMGWRVIRVTEPQIKDGSAIQWIKRALMTGEGPVAPPPF